MRRTKRLWWYAAALTGSAVLLQTGGCSLDSTTLVSALVGILIQLIQAGVVTT